MRQYKSSSENAAPCAGRLTEAAVAVVQVPEIDAQVVCADVCFSVRIDRDGVDVVGMCVGVYFSWNRGDDLVLSYHSREAEGGNTVW